MADRGGRRKRALLAVGAVAASVASVAASVAAERAFVRRDRARPDPFRDEPYGTLFGKSIGPTISFDGTPLHVEEFGAGQTVIFAHGFSLGARIWHHQMKGLADEARLVFFDQRGHGFSGRPDSDDFTMDALARDIDAVIRDVSPDEPVVLVGHSLGGMAILKYCEMFAHDVGTRVNGIVLSDTTSADVMGGMMPGMARRIEAALQGAQEVLLRVAAGKTERLDMMRSRSKGLSYIGTRLMAFGKNPSPTQIAFLEQVLSDCPSDIWFSLIPSMTGLNVHEALPAIRVPTAILVGSFDRLTPLHAAERMAEAIPLSELVVLHGAGHTPMLEQPEEFNEQIRRLLARVRHRP